MEDELRALLTASAAVTAVVPAGRINWGSHPQGAGKPYIVLTLIGGAEGLTQQGSDGLETGRAQIDCYGQTYGAAKTAARAVTKLLHGHRGYRFDLVQHVATRDSREGGTNEAERLFRVSLDFTMAWRET